MKNQNKDFEDFSDLQNALNNIPADSKKFIDNSIDITRYLNVLLKYKNIRKKDLSVLLGKTEPEINKWLSGMHNLTLRTISKLEVVLGIEIINPKIKLSPESLDENAYIFNDYLEISAKQVTERTYHGSHDYITNDNQNNLVECQI